MIDPTIMISGDFSSDVISTEVITLMRVWTLTQLSYDSFGTLQWVELIGMPTFEATSTVRALITSMQNPLWIDKDRRRQKTNRKINERQNGAWTQA